MLSEDQVFRVTGLDAGVTGEVALPAISDASYLVRRVTVHSANANLGATTSTLSLRTASGGGGTAIVDAQALTSLTAATVATDLTIAGAAVVQTASTLYLRIVQNGGPVAGTISVQVEIQPLA